MASFQYFSSHVPQLSAALNVQDFPVDHLFSKLSFRVLQQSLKHSSYFLKVSISHWMQGQRNETDSVGHNPGSATASMR